jgi:hypothetical protein
MVEELGSLYNTLHADHQTLVSDMVKALADVPPKKAEVKPKARPKKSAPAWALAMSTYLNDQIALNGGVPSNKPEAWAADIDKLHRIDGLHQQDIKSIIDWATAHDFWAPNVMSGKSLRKNYRRLLTGCRKDSGSMARARANNEFMQRLKELEL